MVPQETALLDHLTVTENLALAAKRGMPRGLGWALSRHMRDEFRDHVSRLGMRLEERPTASTVSPLGVKGVGESGCTGSLPAIASAVLDALAPLGITHLDMPFTPYRVWQAIHHREKQ